MNDVLGSITLTQLRNFHKLAETEHFTDAAKQLYITQPTLSASIKALENELGVSLFYREGRRSVRLTEAGKAFDTYIGQVLSNLEDIVADIKQRNNPGINTLALGTIPTIQYDFLPALLCEIWNNYGYSSKIRITVEFSNPLIEGLKNQDYEVIFCAHVPEETDLAFFPMMYLPLVAVVNNEGPYKELKSLSLSDLHDIHFATYHEDTPIGRETRALLNTTPPPAKSAAYV